MTDKYKLNDDHSISECNDVIEWGKAFESVNRKVAETEVGDARISTVFIGLDHSFGNGDPLLFETMIFGGPRDDHMRRYATWDDALIGHHEMVATERKMQE